MNYSFTRHESWSSAHCFSHMQLFILITPLTTLKLQRSKSSPTYSPAFTAIAFASPAPWISRELAAFTIASVVSIVTSPFTTLRMNCRPPKIMTWDASSLSPFASLRLPLDSSAFFGSFFSSSAGISLGFSLSSIYKSIFSKIEQIDSSGLVKWISLREVKLPCSFIN